MCGGIVTEGIPLTVVSAASESTQYVSRTVIVLLTRGASRALRHVCRRREGADGLGALVNALGIQKVAIGLVTFLDMFEQPCLQKFQDVNRQMRVDAAI